MNKLIEYHKNKLEKLNNQLDLKPIVKENIIGLSIIMSHGTDINTVITALLRNGVTDDFIEYSGYFLKIYLECKIENISINYLHYLSDSAKNLI